ncbi:MAG TPA: hypothetical protein VJ770_07075 [Stellaceae bacterium]|nr:hypothetical protein [Stellaceae bacterium]
MKATSGGYLLRGAVAGAIGAWVMDRATWLLQDREPRPAIARERAAWPEGLDVSHALGYHLAEWAGIPADRAQPSTLGMVTHYLLGIAPAVLYAALRERDLRFAADRGLLYGFLIFVLWDEILSAATRIAGPPGAYPWQAHLRGLVGHLSLGAATHVALTALETDFDLRPLSAAHPGA